MDIWFKPSTARSLRLLTMYLIECPGQGCPNRFQSCKGAREPVLSSNIIYMSLRDWTTLLRQHSHSYSLSAHQNTTGKRLNWSIEKSKLTRCRNDIQGLAGRDNTIWNQIGDRVKCGRGPHFGQRCGVGFLPTLGVGVGFFVRLRMSNPIIFTSHS